MVCLDMNGTLCYRCDDPLEGAREDLFIRHRYYYARPGIRDFVRRLVSSRFFSVYVYTSMMAHNAEAGLNAILPSYKTQLAGVLDRDMTMPDPGSANDWDTVRDMEKARLPCPRAPPSPACCCFPAAH